MKTAKRRAMQMRQAADLTDGEAASKRSAEIHQPETKSFNYQPKNVQIKLTTLNCTTHKKYFWGIKALGKIWSQSFVTETRSMRSERTLISTNRKRLRTAIVSLISG